MDVIKMKVYLIFCATFVVASLLFLNNKLYAQARSQKPTTIYYLIDTSRTPFNDRLVNISRNNNQQFYTINCPCLSEDNEPVFRTNFTNYELVDKNDVMKISFISLPNLIKFLKQNDSPDFDERFTVFFIESVKSKYIKRRVFFLGGRVTKTN